MKAGERRLDIKARLYCGGEIALGPGKADLLEAIAAHGSISAAGRALGMSYRRTWLLVDTMNRCWAESLVETSAGGSRGGGARLSPLGRQLLEQYRMLERQIADAVEQGAWPALREKMLPQPRSADQN